jgi:hypothetical protein
MSALRPYRSIEHPQAWLSAAEAAAIELTGTDAWVKYAAGGIVLEQQSGDVAGQSVSTDGSTITIGTPGMWRVRLTCSYSSDLSVAGDVSLPITLDRSSLDEPTEQALEEGAEYTSIEDSPVPLAFERIIHVDSSETLALFAYLEFGGELGAATLSLGFVSVEVEYIGPPSYPLPGFWNISAADTIVQANLLASGDPVADTAAVQTLVRREGVDNWEQATVVNRGTFQADGFDSLLPGLSLVGGIDPDWYQLDAQASQFNGDPSFVYFELFDAPTAGGINTLMCLANASSEYCYIAESSSNLTISRNGSTALSVQQSTGSLLVSGRNWIVVSRDAAAQEVTMWINSTTPALGPASLAGGVLNPTELTLGTYRDSSPTITLSSTRIVRRSHLAVNKTYSQAQVEAIHRTLTHWGEL